MKFDIDRSIEILERTPHVLETFLKNVSDDWALKNEGGETWSAYDIVGHFIHGEKTDWMNRMEIILSDAREKKFVPFDRFAQFEESKGKTLTQLLEEFKKIRAKNIASLRSKQLTIADLKKTGIHPKFGLVTLEQLLSTWTVHDLAHMGQMMRVMAKQYKDEVGPWKEYLPILTK